jgi:hypothetical protein
MIASVNRVTRLRAERPGYDSRQGGRECFSSPPRPDRLWGPPSLLANGYLRSGCEAATHPHLVPRLRMHGAVPPLPQYAFMVRYLVKQ